MFLKSYHSNLLQSTRWSWNGKAGVSTLRGPGALRAFKEPPSNAGEVVAWAQQQFLQEISGYHPDSSINLAKVCLLLALEEEASQQLESAPATQARTAATASTWSLSRLDGLAAEVIDTLAASDSLPRHLATCTSSSSSSSSGTVSTSSGPSSNAVSEAVAALDAYLCDDAPSSPVPSPPTSAASSTVTAAAAGPELRQLVQQFPMLVLNAVNSVLFNRHGYSACNRFGASIDSQLSSVMEDGPGSCAALTILYLEVCKRLGLQLSFKVVDDGRYCLVWPKAPTADQQQNQQVQQAPRQQHQPNNVYSTQIQEECVQQAQQRLQQQQQQQQHVPLLLSAAGEACVVDVYGAGALLTVKEVTELFGIEDHELLTGSTERELLASLLLEQQMAHWCAAVGCSPAPAFMTPLTAGTAVRQVVRQLHGASIERAAAAAEKRVALLPGDQHAQLQLALLCYFSGRYEDAWLELGSYLECVRAAAAAHQERQQQQHEGQDVAATQAGGSGIGPPSAGKVTELHAAVQSMLMGGAIQSEVPPPVAATATAAEAALASADDDDAEAISKRKETQEMDDVVLLFQKLQLELMMAGDRAAGG